MTNESKTLISADTIRRKLPDVLINTRKLLDRKGAVGVITMVFFENGDVVESSDVRLLSLYQSVGSLEMVKARYLRGTNESR